jgi:hypothetical protein
VAWSSISPITFLLTVSIFIAIPTAIGSLVIWRMGKAADFDYPVRGVASGDRARSFGRNGPGPLSRAATACVALLLGFVTCVGWLSWSGYSDSVEFSYPPPTEFPPWQIWGCGITLVMCSVSAFLLAERKKSGSLISPLYIASGFATAMAVGVSHGATSQGGVGVVFSMFGLTIGLGIVTAVCARLWQVITRH